jgi:NitT/TauT family transport system permease protein
VRRFARSFAAPLGVLLAWEAGCRLWHINPALLPPPSQVARKWVEYLRSGELPLDTWSTFFRVLVGFAIGAGLALPLGLWMGAREKAYGLLNPLIQILRPIPPIAYIPLSILWFGLGNPPAFFLIALGAFFRS